MCTSHLSCSDCINADECGWCSVPEDGPRCNKITNWVSKDLFENGKDNGKFVCGEDVFGWKVNVSNNGQANFFFEDYFNPIEHGEHYYTRSEFSQEENILHVQAKIDAPINLSVQWNTTLFKRKMEGYSYVKNPVTESIQLAFASHEIYDADDDYEYDEDGYEKSKLTPTYMQKHLV